MNVMNIRQLSPQLSISAQIAAIDIPAIAAQGFRTVICNRPDGEKEGQPTFEEILRASENLGLESLHLPVIAKSISQADVNAFAELVERLPKPILAYCATGTRAAILWALTQVGKLQTEEILELAQRAGVDTKALSARLQTWA